MTEAFLNSTTDGNEPAIRRGKVVPDDAVNLAFVRAPRLSPEENVVVIDTSRIVEENAVDSASRRKLYYANSLGVLEDEFGNQLVDEEFPYVTDVFSVDENFSLVPGSEYTDDDILPFVHVSRHFHLDLAGLTLPGDLYEFREDLVKVIDARGRLYLNVDGLPRYKVRIAPAVSTNMETGGDQMPYRVHVYIDTMDEEELYLVYNKIELTVGGQLVNQKVGYKELLNPRPVFAYVPEESEVVDFSSWHNKIYSTKPIALKSEILGLAHPPVDGYRVYVPKKAKGDPRIFQLFHWRLECDFIQAYQVDAARQGSVINVGVVITNSQPRSNAPFAFHNLERSGRNARDIDYINPMAPAGVSKDSASYWYVNLDTISEADLAKFDMLIWAPVTPNFDFKSPTNYGPIIDNFTRNMGGTLFIDTSSSTVVGGLEITTTNGVNYVGRTTTSGGAAGVARADNPDPTVMDTLINGNQDPAATTAGSALGGWNLLDGTNNDEIQSLSIRQGANGGWGPNIDPAFVPSGVGVPPGYTQYITGYPADYTPVLKVGGQTVTIRKRVGSFGHLIFSTFGHLYTCSAYINSVADSNGAVAVLHPNTGAQIAPVHDWSVLVDSIYVEGAMKLLANATLVSVSGRSLADRDPKAYASKWTLATEWRSSWVIDGDVLSKAEQERHRFARAYEDAATPNNQVWKRRLSERTCVQLIDDALSTSGMSRQAEGSDRVYRLEIKNEAVKTDAVTIREGSPQAWTTAYTPSFEIPQDLGPNVVREEEYKGQYGSGEYRFLDYPSKDYGGYVRASYATSSEQLATKHVTWTATGTATHVWTDYIDHPPTSVESRTEIELTWATRPKFGSQQFYVPGNGPRTGFSSPNGLTTWGESNYNRNSLTGWALNWPYAGFTNRYATSAHGDVVSSGEVVKFIQAALNEFRRRGGYDSSAGYLAEDGNYSARTDTAIRGFQTALGARFIDGIIDAETWSIIGYQIIRFGLRSGGRQDHYRFFDYPWNFLPLQRASDLNFDTVYAKRSWYRRGTIGPSTIWDYIQVTFDQEYDIHAITVAPYLEGQTQTLLVRSAQVSNEFSLTGYTGAGAHEVGLWRPRNDEVHTFLFAPRRGNTITVGIGQDGPAGPGWGDARFMGVKDIRARANVLTSTVIPGTREPVSRSEIIAISDSGALDVTSFSDETQRAAPDAPAGGYLTDPHWTSLTYSGEGVSAVLTPDGLITFKSRLVELTGDLEAGQVDGPYVGREGARPTELAGGIFYSTDENRALAPVREVGVVSKSDGIKLLCKLDRSPYGFPSMPTDVGAYEFQRHFVSLALTPLGNDTNVMMGFYDVLRKEFVTDSGLEKGLPVISYIEWTSRGPHNIYIAVLASYEAPEVMRQIPDDEDAPKLPYRWAMPVYGIYRRAGARITLEPLPKHLGLTDVWPIAVRDGRFSRLITIRARAEGYLTTWVRNYQGSTVRANYSLPDGGAWSTLHGPPFADVVGEEPLILDDDIIQVRQAPILQVTEPTPHAGHADPVRPVLKVWRRAAFDSEWVAQPWSEIRDYNASTGEIFLTTQLTVDDPGLLKVDYTTERRHYHFKSSGSTLLNLNPWSEWSREHLGEAIYVYLVPRYVVDATGAVIVASVTDQPLRFATSPNIFDPMRPEYDPLAVMLGIIYVSAAFDIANLTILDTRHRGGGAREGLAAAEVARLVAEATTYWDVGYAAGPSYQKGGFVVVRLPVELKDSFTEAEIAAVVERNLTAGVRFKLEDLSGNEWS